MIGGQNQCSNCKHLDREARGEASCSAFPGGIPDVIWMEYKDHSKPVAGDHGIQYEPIPGQKPIVYED